MSDPKGADQILLKVYDSGAEALKTTGSGGGGGGGDASAANQVIGNASLSSIDSKTPSLGQALSAASTPVVLPAAQISALTPLSTVTANAGTNLNTSLLALESGGNLTAINTNTAAGATAAHQTDGNQKTQVTSLPSIPTGSNTIGIVDQGIGGSSAWKVDGSAVTQPVSASALPLPSGAATSSLQTTANTSLSSIDSKITAVNTGAVVVSSSALPSGASTSALQTTANTSLASIDSKLTAPISTTNSTTHTIVNNFRNDYSSNNATTSAYLQVLASTSGTIKKLEIFDSSGQTLWLATGGAGVEVNLLYIMPGGNGMVPIDIASGVRLSVKAVSATANSGELTVNVYNNP